MNKHITECPVCAGKKFSEHLTCEDYLVSHKQFQLMKCDDCGFVFTQDFPVEAEIGEYYKAEDYVSHSDTNKGLFNKLYHLVRHYMLGQKYRWISRYKKGGKLLDIGTGTGYFPAYMREKGYDIRAVEISADARAFAKKHFDLDIDAPSKLNDYASQSFDVITMWHVMEHVEDLQGEWDILKRLLKPNGVLVIAVPNNASKNAAMYGRYWAAWDVPRHLWHFTPATMEHIASNHGFKIIGRCFMPFDEFYNAILSEQHKNSSMALLKGGCKGFVSWLYSCKRPTSVVYFFQNV